MLINGTTTEDDVYGDVEDGIGTITLNRPDRRNALSDAMIEGLATLLQDMQEERDMGLILITHDMGVVADVADKICVMYAGRVVERADVMSIYEAPAHPYTKALLESIPRIDMKGQDLASITGLPPNLTQLPSGCSFHPRCTFKTEKCEREVPPLFDVAEPVKSGPGAGSPRQSACHYYEEVLQS